MKVLLAKTLLFGSYEPAATLYNVLTKHLNQNLNLNLKLSTLSSVKHSSSQN